MPAGLSGSRSCSGPAIEKWVRIQMIRTCVHEYETCTAVRMYACLQPLPKKIRDRNWRQNRRLFSRVLETAKLVSVSCTKSTEKRFTEPRGHGTETCRFARFQPLLRCFVKCGSAAFDAGIGKTNLTGNRAADNVHKFVKPLRRGTHLILFITKYRRQL